MKRHLLIPAACGQMPRARDLLTPAEQELRLAADIANAEGC